MPLEHERASVHIEYTSDIDYRNAIHKRISETNRNPTVFKSGQIFVTVDPGVIVLETGEFDAIYSVFVENLSTDTAIDVVYNDSVAAQSLRLAATDRLLVETVSAAAEVSIHSTATTAGVYYYISGTHAEV